MRNFSLNKIPDKQKNLTPELCFFGIISNSFHTFAFLFFGGWRHKKEFKAIKGNRPFAKTLAKQTKNVQEGGEYSLPWPQKPA